MTATHIPRRGRRRPWAAVLAAAAALVAGPLAAQAPTGAPAASAVPAAPRALTLAPLQWLAGCWASEIDEPGSGEVWLPAAGGTMLGMARTLKGGRTVQFEFMQLRESATGLVFVAHPSGQAGTRFAALEASETSAVFENPGHDFPQRVIYRLLPDGRLAARIEGLRNGELRAVDFPMRRGPCPGAAPAR